MFIIKESLKSDGKKFHQYQQNKHPPLTENKNKPLDIACI
jgi:hypothetical protein